MIPGGNGGNKEAIENHDDEAQILADQDLTNENDITELDENLGAKSHSLDDLENEPADFMRGEVDVTEQMERTTRAMDSVIYKREIKPDVIKSVDSDKLDESAAQKNRLEPQRH